MQTSLLTQRDTATRLNVSERTLEGWRLRGGGPQFVRLGTGSRRLVRYRSEDLDRWVSGRLAASTSQPLAA